MITTVFRIGCLRLRNSPMEVVLMFLVPILFFSIFAVIFGRGLGSGKSNPVKTVFVDEANTGLSRAILEQLLNEPGLRNVSSESDGATSPWGDAVLVESKAIAQQMIQDGNAVLAIVVPIDFRRTSQGSAKSIDGDLSSPGGSVTEADENDAVDTHRSDDTADEGDVATVNQIELLADTSDQIATQVGAALVRQAVLQRAAEAEFRALQQSAAQAAGMRSGIGPSSEETTPGTTGDLETQSADSGGEDEVSALTDPVRVTDVLSADVANPRISMYAAGIAVMFLLFSASGAGGTLLEEMEAGTLERLLTSQLSISQLLAGKWLFITVAGFLQVTVMFVWAQVVFKVDLLGHLPGFLIMTVSTSAAAASLALLLATACRSRSQLNGISVILILTMSALGGSMVPRYIMSESMQQYGLITFNAWALDGYNKIFWRNLPIDSLRPQVAVLIATTVVMAFAARIFASRWKA